MSRAMKPSRLLIRTASNAWFPQVVSVLSLPDRGSEVDQAVAELWSRLEIVSSPTELGFVRKYPEVADGLAAFSDDEVFSAIVSRRSGGVTGDRPIKQCGVGRTSTGSGRLWRRCAGGPQLPCSPAP